MIVSPLRPITDLWRQAFYGWALQEINPQHADLLRVRLAHDEAVRGVDGSRTAVRLRTVLAPFAIVTLRVLRAAIGKSALAAAGGVARLARAAWRWC